MYYILQTLLNKAKKVSKKVNKIYREYCFLLEKKVIELDRDRKELLNELETLQQYKKMYIEESKKVKQLENELKATKLLLREVIVETEKYKQDTFKLTSLIRKDTDISQIDTTEINDNTQTKNKSTDNPNSCEHTLAHTIIEKQIHIDRYA